MEGYIKTNKAWWNSRVNAHYESKFYDVPAFLKSKNSLNKIELDLLGNLKGKKVLHLQCHFGMDSISLANLGAEVTAIDFSLVAIQKAKELAKKMSAKVDFIQCDVYQLKNYLEGDFDIVFTSYGTIIWLPDLDKWASTIEHFLKPQGQFVFVDFHPIVWMMDDDLKQIAYAYSSIDPIILDEANSYAERNNSFETKHITWNHGIAKVFQALKNRGLICKDLQEYNSSPYPFQPACDKVGTGAYQIKHLKEKIPLVYSLVAEK